MPSTNLPDCIIRLKEEIESEYQTILKCQHDPKYFAPIYEKYYDVIYVFIDKRIDHEEVSADLTSKVFFNCLKNISKYKHQGVPFSAWLFKIALNEVNQFYRKQQHRERIVTLNDAHVCLLLEELDNSKIEIDPNTFISTLPGKTNRQRSRINRIAFSSNSIQFRKIGYLLGLSEVNAKVKTYRVIDKLRKIAEEIN